jgi:penicillin-binding protein 1C
MKNRKLILLSLLMILSIAFWFSLPSKLFNDAYSKVLYDKDGHLLSASIAQDGQWRFPEQDSVPHKFKHAILLFEDEYFYYHPGINPLAIARAFYQNIISGKIKSGGSTITMQISRLSRQRKGKSWWDKLTEALLALRIELKYSKTSILNIYASHAPFGGNVVGLDAASWRYFAKNAHELTWAEAATLAVLPNSPSLIFPGKNAEKLREKRNRLLHKLFDKGHIHEIEYSLALEEALPEKPHALPQHAIHLLHRAVNENKSLNKIHSSIDINLQQKVEYVLMKNKDQRAANGIAHAAILVLDVKTGETKAYAGNVNYFAEDNGAMVDMINAPRSTGSILKPFLFAAMLSDGKILSQSLIPDIPTQIGGYVPKNFNLTYDGAVTAQKAISRSLNIPAVRMLKTYGIAKFQNLLRQLGMSTLQKGPLHYGLALILGGAEGRLDELCVIYANLARHLKYFEENDQQYLKSNELKFNYLLKNTEPADVENKQIADVPLHAAQIYEMFNAMIMVSRPDEEASWGEFASGKKVAWKTGTSFGHRDAWSIGITGNYVVGVWVGNADGVASASLTGIGAAAPLMFDVFSFLPTEKWFEKPVDDYVKIKVCKKSGYTAGLHCGDEVMLQSVPIIERNRVICPFHQLIFTDKVTGERVNASCADPADFNTKSYFILPPAIEFYYKQKHPDYLPLPPVKEGCNTLDDFNQMEVIYPKDLSEIFIPINWKGEHGKVVFEAAHRDADARIFWSLDGKYIGQTVQMHRMSMFPEPGDHMLTLMDMQGNKLQRRIKVMVNTKK